MAAKKMKNPTKQKSVKVSPRLSAGNIVLIRTAVYHAIGRVVGVFKIGDVSFVQLSEAAFVGDTGRYHEATSIDLDKVSSAEIEPVGLSGLLDVQIGMICDVAVVPSTVTKTV